METHQPSSFCSMTMRFTLDGGEVLERMLAEICEQSCEGLKSIIPARELHSIILGGGYGRGEGGVLVTGTGELPYNDLEFYVLLRGNDFLAKRRYGARVHELSKSLSQSTSIEVEFELISPRKIQMSPVSMFYYDLVSGHRLVDGSEAWLTRCDHHRAAHRIPLHEATRLLMNRCSGLLFAQERLLRPDWSLHDADFVGRNMAKAKLAFGDVLLTMRGQYHWSCRERHKRLTKLVGQNPPENLVTILLLHEQGVEFKLHPTRTTRNADELLFEFNFLKEIGRELWLELESKRLGKKFASLTEYCGDSRDKCPETSALKNRFINVRTFGIAGLGWTGYPRERLLRSLPLLLWNDGGAESLPVIQKQLRTSEKTFSGLVRAYESLWRMYN